MLPLTRKTLPCLKPGKTNAYPAGHIYSALKHPRLSQKLWLVISIHKNTFVDLRFEEIKTDIDGVRCGILFARGP